MDVLSHCATVTCSVAAGDAFAYVADGATLGSWALGCWDSASVGDGLVRGVSLLDGSATFVRPEPDPARLTVDFRVGDDEGTLVRRISVRVVPGPELGYRDEECLVTVIAWRPAGMSDDRWQQLVTTHEAEVLLLRARLEAR